ncbi:MAG: CDP-alcohol phosphatidyltransferase family protein [Thermoproteota archaeon]|nr:CDP-alcohol phosphatidyltransferase family protein [Candidatus Brockarchaeota archaeon]
MVLGSLRRKSERIFSKLGVILAPVITPTGLTILGLLSAVTAALFYSYRHLFLAGVAILFSGLFDVLDGVVARITKRVSGFGGTLDALVDRYTEFFYVLGPALGGYIEWPLAYVAMFSVIASSYVRARAESVGEMEDASVGVLERVEKILIISIATFLNPFFNWSIMFSMILLIVFGQITVLQRLYATWRFWAAKKPGQSLL